LLKHKQINCLNNFTLKQINWWNSFTFKQIIAETASH